MRQLFERIVDFMEENGSINHRYRDVYVYALQTSLVYMINLASGAAIGIFMGEWLPCVLFLISLIMLREYAGGYHASGWIRCYFLSCGILVFTLAWMKIQFTGQSWLTVIAALAAGISIFVRAPLEDENKPLEEEQRELIGKRARIIVSIEMIAGIAALFWKREAAYAVLGSVIWCGIGYFAWYGKKKICGEQRRNDTAELSAGCRQVHAKRKTLDEYRGQRETK